MRHFAPLLCLVLTVVATTARAQDPAEAPAEASADAIVEAPAAVPPVDARAVMPPRPLPPLVAKGRTDAASGLPLLADNLRAAGIAAEDLAVAMHAFAETGATALDMAGLLGTIHLAARQHGRTDGLGEFVQARLVDGLSGRELSAAIRTEFATHGERPAPPPEPEPEPGAAEAAAPAPDPAGDGAAEEAPEAAPTEVDETP